MNLHRDQERSQPMKSVCTVFKPKTYKRFTPTVFIGDDTLKFTKEAKNLG